MMTKLDKSMIAGQAGLKNRKKAFTLVELLVTILILAVIGIGLGSYIRVGADIYSDTVNREQILSASRYVIERITRELREAVPNSIRVNRVGSVQCVEFLPILASSTYINVPKSPEPLGNTIRVVQHGVAGISPNKIIVYPLSSGQIYSDFANQTAGRTFALSSLPGVGTAATDVSLSNSVLFDADSPTERYFLANTAVSYCADSSTDQIHRYSNYWPCNAAVPTSCGQQFPPSSVSGALQSDLMAEGQTNATPFIYSGSTLLRNAVIQINFVFERDGESIALNHEAHVVNVP